jgi:dTDP-4-dehydrorhamnose 3,5-epimerase
MKILKTNIKDLLVIVQKNNKDNRGSLRETFNQKLLKKKFVFEYCTTSKNNVVRGFHFQTKFPQAKYVNVVKGKILDVVVDLRLKSKTFGKIFKIILSAKNAKGLYIPRGFGHAYYSFDKENIIYYKLDNFYKPKFEHGIIYNDKKFNIKWPQKKLIVSKKDSQLISFEKFCKVFKGLY